MDIKIKKAKTKNKEKLVNESQAINQVKRRANNDSPQHGVKFRNILLLLGYRFYILIVL
jgi:hypothetical protein